MSAQRGFATGDCYAVVSPTAIVVLPAMERARVGGLWELADSGASPQVLLDALLAGGLSALSDFAWVSETEDVTRLILRGTATASVCTEAGGESVAAPSGSMWHEFTVPADSLVRISLAGESALQSTLQSALEHPLLPGISRVGTIACGGAGDALTTDGLHEEPATHAPAVEPPAGVPPVVTDPVVEESEAAPPGLTMPMVAVPLDAQPLAQQVAQPIAEPVADYEPEPELELEPDLVVREDWSDRDGQTVIGDPTPEFDRPPIPGQEIAPDVVSHPVASLVFSTGDVIAVDRTVLVGRAPEARQFASHDQPRVVTVSSPHQEISSTHLEIRPGAGADHGSAIATDLGSTNGTMLVQPGLAPEELQPGIAVSLIPGAVLDLGDGVTIQVTDP